MTITLDLRPECEERILAEAKAQGLSIEAYLVCVIEALSLPTIGEHVSLEEFDAVMDELPPTLKSKTMSTRFLEECSGTGGRTMPSNAGSAEASGPVRGAWWEKGSS